MDKYITFWTNQFDKLDNVFETKFVWRNGTWGFNKVYKHYLSEKLPNKIAALVAEKYSDYKGGKTNRENAIKSLVSELKQFQKNEGMVMKTIIKEKLSIIGEPIFDAEKNSIKFANNTDLRTMRAALRMRNIQYTTSRNTVKLNNPVDFKTAKSMLTETKKTIKLSELRGMIREVVQRKLMMERFDWEHDAPDNIKPYGKIIEKYFYIQESWRDGTDVFFLMEDDAGYFVVMVNVNNEKFSIGVPGDASVDAIGIMRFENSLKKFISITKQAIDLGKYHSDDDSF